MLNLNIAKSKNQLNILLTVVLVLTFGCQTSTPDANQPVSDTRSDTQLVLNNAVLKQSNQNKLWKIKADRIVYSEDKQTATLDKVIGNLLQDDKIILKISANKGTVSDNGNLILLNGDIIVSDSRNDSVINANAIEWRPQENLLLIKDDLAGIYPNLRITATQGKYFTDRESLEIQGNVIATTNQPSLQLKSDRLMWDIPQEKITSPDALEIVRYDKKTITDKLTSDRAEVNLTENTVVLNENIELITLDPQLQMATDSLTWNYQQRTGKTDRPIQIVDRDRQISLTGNGGEIDLVRSIAKLRNGVKGISSSKPSELYARQLTWNIDTEKIEATGNVIYEQSDPQAYLTGEKAAGTLGDNDIVVTSDGKQQVTTIINN